MKKYLIIIEKTGTGYSAFSPDLPGCVATGATEKEVEENMRKAVPFHTEGLRDYGESIPEPHSYSTYLEIPV